MVAAEVVKQQLGAGRRRELFYFRDQQGLEVDFIVPAGHRKLVVAEAKASRTVAPAMADSLRRLARAMTRYRVDAFVVHRPPPSAPRYSALGPGVQAGTLADFLAKLPR